MRALSLWQPWAFSVAAGKKKIENRSWKPPITVIGETIALHASQTYDRSGESSLIRWGVDVSDERAMVRGAIIGTVVFGGYIPRDAGVIGGCIPRDADVIFEDLAGRWKARRLAPNDPMLVDPMFCRNWPAGDGNKYGWVVARAHLFAEPIRKVIGRQQLFYIDPKTERDVKEAERDAISRENAAQVTS